LGMSGTGWTCTLTNLTCTHAASFSPGATSTITLTASVNSNAASSVTNTATLSGGNDINTANNSASDQTTVNAGGLIPPTNVVVHVLSPTQVNLSWDPVSAAARYDIYRNPAPPVGLQSIALPTGTTYTDTGLTQDTAYSYIIRSVDATGGESVGAFETIATTTIFIDNSLTAGTTIKAVHLTQLRTAVDAVRILAGLSPGVYTDVNPAGATVKAVHITELRSALIEARNMMILFPLTFTNATVTTGATVKAVDLQELRSGVNGR
jgi:hypothetical protein